MEGLRGLLEGVAHAEPKDEDGATSLIWGPPSVVQKALTSGKIEDREKVVLALGESGAASVPYADVMARALESDGKDAHLFMACAVQAYGALGDERNVGSRHAEEVA